MINITYNHGNIIKKPKIYWHKKYIPPGTNTHTTYFIENREGIPMSSCLEDIGEFLCGFLTVWLKEHGARAPP